MKVLIVYPGSGLKYHIDKYMSRSTRKRTLFTLRNVSIQISLCSPRRLIRSVMLRLIRVDTLRRVNNVGFLVEWLICIRRQSAKLSVKPV